MHFISVSELKSQLSVSKFHVRASKRIPGAQYACNDDQSIVLRIDRKATKKDVDKLVYMYENDIMDGCFVVPVRKDLFTF